MIKAIIALGIWLETIFATKVGCTVIFQFDKMEDAFHAADRLTRELPFGAYSAPVHVKGAVVRQIAGVPIEFHWKESVITVKAGKVP